MEIRTITATTFDAALQEARGILKKISPDDRLDGKIFYYAFIGYQHTYGREPHSFIFEVTEVKNNPKLEIAV